MPAFYTREGDDGYTGLLGEGRVPKYHLRPQSYGTVDESSAALGLARSLSRSEDTQRILRVVQRDLYHIMAELAATKKTAQRFRKVTAERVLWLERQVDELSEKVELPEDFIISGDTTAGAAIDLARTIVRRAERLVAQLQHEEMLKNPHLLRYLNRLSSLCFVLGLWEDRMAGAGDPRLAKYEAE
jgi:cob(I)alamin adenosyltransferase